MGRHLPASGLRGQQGPSRVGPALDAARVTSGVLCGVATRMSAVGHPRPGACVGISDFSRPWTPSPPLRLHFQVLRVPEGWVTTSEQDPQVLGDSGRSAEHLSPDPHQARGFDPPPEEVKHSGRPDGGARTGPLHPWCESCVLSPGTPFWAAPTLLLARIRVTGVDSARATSMALGPWDPEAVCPGPESPPGPLGPPIPGSSGGLLHPFAPPSLAC